MPTEYRGSNGVNKYNGLFYAEYYKIILTK